MSENPQNKMACDYRNWKPVPHGFFKDKQLEKTIHLEGYAVVPFINEEQIEAIRTIYRKYHRMDKEGTMFFGVFANDLEYRKTIHEATLEILKPSFEKYFENYRDALSCFVIKAGGGRNEFFIHQDPSYVDEFRFSHLHVWCPIEDVGIENGPLCVLPKSHAFFYPYRSISFPQPFENIKPLMRRYMKPLELKAGQAIFLDPRVIHNSLANIAEQARAVLLSQIYPKDAQLMTPYFDAENDQRLEYFNLPDDYFLKNTNFLNNVVSRPEVGEFAEYRDFEFEYTNEEQFLKLCEQHDLKPLDLLPDQSSEDVQMVGEPY